MITDCLAPISEGMEEGGGTKLVGGTNWVGGGIFEAGGGTLASEVVELVEGDAGVSLQELILSRRIFRGS